MDHSTVLLLASVKACVLSALVESSINLLFFRLFRASHVLLSSGVCRERALTTVRLSVGRETTADDVEAAVADLQQAVFALKNGT